MEKNKDQDTIKMNKSIRWGVIGCGNVTEVKSVPAYKQVDGFEVVSVMRRDLDLAKDYAQRHDITNYTSNADDIIADIHIDAIYIATPPDSHHHYAIKTAKAGKICCIEKPMAPSFHECKEITQVFKDKNLPLFVSYYRRSLPRFQKVKELLDKKSIGEVRHINWQFHKPANDMDLSGNYNWRTDKKIAYAGYFDDLASHGLDLFIHLLGNIEDASGFSSNQQGLYTAMDTVTGHWVHENGITGSGYWNFGAFERKDIVEIIGSKGSIGFSVFGEAPINMVSLKNQETYRIANPEHIQYYHAKNMKKAIETNTEHPSTGSTATHTAWVMDKILGKIK